MQCRLAFGWVVCEGEWGRYFRGFFWVLPLIYTLSDLWQNNLICDKVQTAMGLSVDVIQLETCTMPPNVGQDLWDPWVGSAPPLWTAVVMILVVAWMLANTRARSLRTCHKSRSLEKCQNVILSFSNLWISEFILGKNNLHNVTVRTVATATSLPVWKALRAM